MIIPAVNAKMSIKILGSDNMTSADVYNGRAREIRMMRNIVKDQKLL